MKKPQRQIINVLLISSLVLMASLTTFGFQFSSADGDFYTQSVGEEMRPFDFEDKYYERNGVNPRMILNRRTGFDRYSVVDYINSDIYRNVRIIGTWPMADFKGDVCYVAPLGELTDEGFTNNEEGKMAMLIAHRFPFFVFPSAVFKNQERQAAVAETVEGYFEKNPLGLSVMVSVEFTAKAASEKGQIEIRKLLQRNGKTLDGTYAIREVAEIEYLTRRGLVTQSFGQQTVYKINRVLEDPTKGAVSPDAFLIMVLDENQKPLEGEMVYMQEFECLQQAGSWCTDRK